MSALQHLQLGYVSKAHGLDGEVVIRTFDPASETLFEVDRVFLKRRDGTEQELEIRDARLSSKDFLVFFEGITRREASLPLVGSTVFVFREDLEPPAEGEFFQGDLIGLEAITEDGAVVGRVEELWSTGEVPTLVIRDAAKKETLLPFADDFVGEVDLPGKRVVVRPIVLEDRKLGDPKAPHDADEG